LILEKTLARSEAAAPFFVTHPSLHPIQFLSLPPSQILSIVSLTTPPQPKARGYDTETALACQDSIREEDAEQFGDRDPQEALDKMERREKKIEVSFQALQPQL